MIVPQATLPPKPTSTAAPTATSVSASVDNIQVDYVYTDPLITVLYPLYGTKILDNYVNITLTNYNSQPVRVITESEIPGYSDKASDTVDIPAKRHSHRWREPSPDAGQHRQPRHRAAG